MECSGILYAASVFAYLIIQRQPALQRARLAESAFQDVTLERVQLVGIDAIRDVLAEFVLRRLLAQPQPLNRVERRHHGFGFGVLLLSAGLQERFAAAASGFSGAGQGMLSRLTLRLRSNRGGVVAANTVFSLARVS